MGDCQEEVRIFFYIYSKSDTCVTCSINSFSINFLIFMKLLMLELQRKLLIKEAMEEATVVEFPEEVGSLNF